MGTPLIQTKDLKKYFKTGTGMLHAVDNVNLSIEKGQTLGVVGESGCGKSTLGRTILRLLPATGGSVFFDGKDIQKLGTSEMKRMRSEMQIIFQDPYASLNPRLSVSQIIE
ncbi:MAG: ATP-binding cassette domain-containing protein, partial [Emergencia timonensis]